MVLGIVRPEMAMDFCFKEVEPMLDEATVHGQPTYCYGTIKKSRLMVGLKICPCVLLACYCNTPKYTLVVFDMFRVFCKLNLNVS